MYKTVLGQKIKLGKKLVALNNETVSAYLKAVRKGRGLAEKTLLKTRKQKTT
jgi:hypothetical protein